MAGHLAQSAGVVAAGHFDDQEIEMTIAVEVTEIHAHGRKGKFAKGVEGGFAKATAAIVDPEAIGHLEIVADVEIRGAVAVDVAHLGAEAVIKGRGFGLAVGADEELGVPGDGGESALAIIEVEDAGFTDFFDAAVHIAEAMGMGTGEDPFVVDAADFGAAAGA